MDTLTVVSLVAVTALAVLDLWVGVANDAVNFLNSAIGTRVATRRTILIVASMSLLVGVLTSSGLMAVARRGVFDPSRFVDPATGAVLVGSLLIVHLAVMSSDVLLLDLFNTFGLPTSTTVSILSELLGASVAVAYWTLPGGLSEALGVIQSGPVLTMYGGIFLSVLLAFGTGLLVMFAVRLLFGHDLAQTFPRWGWLLTGVATAALCDFVLFKGLKSAHILPPTWGALLADSGPWLMLGLFVPGAVLGLLLRQHYERVLKTFVLAGTGALALAFAGNDLVNFIGPCVAAWQIALTSGAAASDSVSTPSWALLLAGAVMVAALTTSQKARRVTDTEIRLAAHGTTVQRFESTGLARFIVFWGRALFWISGRITPRPIAQRIDKRTAPPPPDSERPPYDLLRATTNLTIASLLISLGTARNLPLSTTYITFMAAMGTALGDRSWGQADAEQRVAGILVVLGGWLITGGLAFGGAALAASIMALGGLWGVLAVLAAVLWGLRRMGGASPTSAEHG